MDRGPNMGLETGVLATSEPALFIWDEEVGLLLNGLHIGGVSSHFFTTTTNTGHSDTRNSMTT